MCVTRMVPQAYWQGSLCTESEVSSKYHWVWPKKDKVKEKESLILDSQLVLGSMNKILNEQKIPGILLTYPGPEEN